MRLEYDMSPEVKQQRQTKYREELQAQMKEREMQKKRYVSFSGVLWLSTIFSLSHERRVLPVLIFRYIHSATKLDGKA